MLKQYSDMLESYILHQYLNKLTRTPSASQTLIDYIISNMHNPITLVDILSCPIISHHNAPYICVNVRVCRFLPHYKLFGYENRSNDIA